MAKLVRKRDNQAFLGMVHQTEVVELQELSATSKEDRFHASGEQKSMLTNFYEQYGMKVDQFVDNHVDCKVTNEAPKLAAIRNRLYINSNKAESHMSVCIRELRSAVSE